MGRRRCAPARSAAQRQAGGPPRLRRSRHPEVSAPPRRACGAVSARGEGWGGRVGPAPPGERGPRRRLCAGRARGSGGAEGGKGVCSRRKSRPGASPVGRGGRRPPRAASPTPRGASPVLPPPRPGPAPGLRWRLRTLVGASPRASTLITQKSGGGGWSRRRGAGREGCGAARASRCRSPPLARPAGSGPSGQSRGLLARGGGALLLSPAGCAVHRRHRLELGNGEVVKADWQSEARCYSLMLSLRPHCESSKRKYTVFKKKSKVKLVNSNLAGCKY